VVGVADVHAGRRDVVELLTAPGVGSEIADVQDLGDGRNG
jgi:hypothetical protein